MACQPALVQHNRGIGELVSSLEHGRLQWLRYLLAGAAGLFLFWVLTFGQLHSGEFMEVHLLCFSYLKGLSCSFPGIPV
jgi:hypothetical protein